MAGAGAERQETDVIKAINNAVKKNRGNPITIVAGKTTLSGIIFADKYKGRQLGGSEPYTDVQFFKKGPGNKRTPINASLKGEAAPSLAGGGLKGLELAVPGIAKKFMKKAFAAISKKFKAGDNIPDIYGKISNNDKLKIVIGNLAMGGPIDYMYIGSMNVLSNYDERKNILYFKNGALTKADEYAKSHDLYFRFRSRRHDQRFDPTAKDQEGTPKIYGVSPSRGDSAGRIVVTDSVPSTGLVVKL